MTIEANGHLVPNGGGDPIPLFRDHLTIGRREPCDIRLPFPNISSRHCELIFHDGYWEIQDLGSTNGFKVNKVRTKKKALKPGDVLTIGKRDYTIKYKMDPNVEFPEEEEAIMGQSLMEKAGLVHRQQPDRDESPRRKRPDLLENVTPLEEEDE